MRVQNKIQQKPNKQTKKEAKNKERIEKRNHVTGIIRNYISSVFIVPCRKPKNETAVTTQTKESPHMTGTYLSVGMGLFHAPLPKCIS